MALIARDRVRRLYCLECGDGSYIPLPCGYFVETHTKKHNLSDETAEESFLVVERPVDDRTIKLDDNLSTMFTKGFLEWGGAVSKASKYEERAKKKAAENTSITVQ